MKEEKDGDHSRCRPPHLLDESVVVGVPVDLGLRHQHRDIPGVRRRRRRGMGEGEGIRRGKERNDTLNFSLH